MKVTDRSVEDLRREVRMQVGCPDCNAVQGHPCIGRTGKVRLSNHIARLRAAKELGYAKSQTYSVVTARFPAVCATCSGPICPGEDMAKGPRLKKAGWSCFRCFESVTNTR